ncbi:transcription initiation factor TFIID subunit 4b-like [Rosa chinensis]|uniref:transcription initiation factor TFIID subunit 4b-like n=1 Tax=Rosa chinensis TaxID=74649 RepID=UPI000D0933DD|nr:transcription initiation factor TFIID subunit 4b-like [Rosa chinensis]
MDVLFQQELDVALEDIPIDIDDVEWARINKWLVVLSECALLKIEGKMPMECFTASPPPSKKQKVADDEIDTDQEGIEQLRDVVSVSGVNLVEEQERMLLLSVPKKRQAFGKLVLQENQEGLVLQKIPLQKKLAGIMGRCGLRIGVDKDVERCLSMCVEERMRRIICNLIRQSKQWVDCEKSRHHTVSTSDVKQEIMILNKKAGEELLEKAQKLNEAKVSTNGFEGVNYKDKHDDGHDKMRRSTAAANVAALAALGGHDILAKWQLKADQLAREKRRGKDVNHKATSTAGRTMNGNVEAEKRGGVEALVSAAGSVVGKFGRNCRVMMMPQTKVAGTRSISVKDVIAVLEKEPQRSKSTLIYLRMNTASQ